MSTTDHLMTTVSMPAFDPKIQYRDPISMFGSCFAEHISTKLDRYKYTVLTNPFGILYNPVSIARSIQRIVHQQYYELDELVLHDGIYHSMDHHGMFSGGTRETVISNINTHLREAHEHLKKNKFVFISPGTSRVYTYKPTGSVAGNCHKIPQSTFDNWQLTLKECVDAFQKTHDLIKLAAPHAHIIWTISPVRHIRDGLIENQKSKSLLLVALDQHSNQNKDAGYFPAYEIMIDQLRDYRYYARDLVHPSDLAVDIIWDLFCKTYLDQGDCEYHPLIEKIKRAMEHRFLHDRQDAIQSFARAQLKNLDQIANTLPDLNWQKERQYFFQFFEKD